MTPVFNKKDELNKDNYGPVSVLSHASRIFEKIPFNQMNLFFEAKFWTPFNQILQESQHKNILLDMI